MPFITLLCLCYAQHVSRTIMPIIRMMLKNKIQLDAIYYFIMLMLCSKCFAHHYAHHQEIKTIVSVTT